MHRTIYSRGVGPGNRPLDMEWLEDFLALVDTGNFSRAAQARAIAQPAFSRHIRSLEEWAGVDLVDRTAHAAGLTAAGKVFLPLLKETLASLEAARIKARAAQERAAASLRFAATHVLSLHFFPRWLASLEMHMRLGPVQTMSDSAQDCEDLMLQRRVQFMLCYGHPGTPGRMDEGHYPMQCLGRDWLVPACAPNGDRGPLYDPDRGGTLPLLAYSEQSGLGRIMRSSLPALRAGASTGLAQGGAAAAFTAHNAVLLKTLAIEGRGLAWLPRSLIAGELASGALVECGADAWKLPLEIRLYRQPHEMAPVAEELWSLCGGPR